MGTLRNTDATYYLSNGDHGNYRYLSLSEIIDSFSATYVGKNKLCEDADMSDISFHAIRSLQELSYDTIKSTKDLEVVVPSTLVVVMPSDYVNYVKLAWSDGNGIERVLYPARKTSNPLDINHDVTERGGFDVSAFTEYQQLSTDELSTTEENFSDLTVSDIGSIDANDLDDEYGELVGGLSLIHI